MYHPSQYQAQARIKMREDLHRSELWRTQQRAGRLRRKALRGKLYDWLRTTVQAVRRSRKPRPVVQTPRRRSSEGVRSTAAAAKS